MKKLLLLPVFLVLLACKRDCPAPAPTAKPTPTLPPTPIPTPTPPPAVVPVVTVPATFSIYDAIFLNQFNTAMNVSVFYLDDKYSVQEIALLFGNLTRAPFPPDTTWTITHTVGPDGFDANPGSFTRKLRVGKRVMLTWRYPEASPNAAVYYAVDGKFLSVITAGQPVKVGVTIDRGRAGL